MEFFTGDIVRMKKPHPCGSFEWEILRVGMEFRLKCMGCGHLVILPRAKFEKLYKKHTGHASRDEGTKGGES